MCRPGEDPVLKHRTQRHQREQRDKPHLGNPSPGMPCAQTAKTSWLMSLRLNSLKEWGIR